MKLTDEQKASNATKRASRKEKEAEQEARMNEARTKASNEGLFHVMFQIPSVNGNRNIIGDSWIRVVPQKGDTVKLDHLSKEFKAYEGWSFVDSVEHMVMLANTEQAFVGHSLVFIHLRHRL